MRLPQPLLQSPYFTLSSIEEVALALSDHVGADELAKIEQLVGVGLPPVTSVDALAVYFGLNPGLIWSFVNRPHIHYRTFELPKGKGVRIINAPRVGLKVIQKWIGYHLSRSVQLPPHVFGFVPGRSHIDAAYVHRAAEWAYSVDIKDFFSTTPTPLVCSALERLGYDQSGASLIARFSALRGVLAQGSPLSPILSNLAFMDLDRQLENIAKKAGAKVTRYADDIVFSGQGVMPESLSTSVKKIFDGTCWSLSQEKERIEPLKGRIKVHGLIVNGPGVRLTKGYRNKIRAYRHIINKGGDITNEASLLGHINYADHVSDRLRYVSAIPVENELFQYPDPVDRPAVALETQFSEPSDQSIISRIARLFGISGRNG